MNFLLKQLRNLNYSGYSFKFYTEYFHVIPIYINLELLIPPICTFCKRDLETIDHIFVECPCVKDIWCGIEEWLYEKLGMHNSFDRQSILFGKFVNKNIHKVENLIILMIKQYIYTSKFSRINTLSIEASKKIVIHRITVEKLLLLKNYRYKEFERYWQEIYDKLDHI